MNHASALKKRDHTLIHLKNQFSPFQSIPSDPGDNFLHQSRSTMLSKGSSAGQAVTKVKLNKIVLKW